MTKKEIEEFKEVGISEDEIEGEIEKFKKFGVPEDKVVSEIKRWQTGTTAVYNKDGSIDFKLEYGKLTHPSEPLEKKK